MRANCHVCDDTESLSHVLLECEVSGQSMIWSLAKQLWLKKNLPWPDLSPDSILGCTTGNFRDAHGRPLPGANRLFTILVFESAYSTSSGNYGASGAFNAKLTPPNDTQRPKSGTVGCRLLTHVSASTAFSLTAAAMATKHYAAVSYNERGKEPYMMNLVCLTTGIRLLGF